MEFWVVKFKITNYIVNQNLEIIILCLRISKVNKITTFKQPFKIVYNIGVLHIIYFYFAKKTTFNMKISLLLLNLLVYEKHWNGSNNKLTYS